MSLVHFTAQLVNASGDFQYRGIDTIQIQTEANQWAINILEEILCKELIFSIEQHLENGSHFTK
jgi:hypothetical protein